MTAENLKKNLLWNAAGNVIYLGCQWLITVLVTIIGGFEDAGVLSVAMSVSAIFQAVAAFGIRSFQISDLKEKYSDSCYVNFRFLTCAAAMVFCVIFSLISGYFGGQLLAICLFMIFRLAECYSDVLHGIAQKKGRLDIAGKSFSIKGIGSLASFLLGYCLSGALNVGIFAMMLFSLGFALCYDLPAVRRLSKFRLFGELSKCRRLALETLPLCLYLVLYNALSMIPKLMLEQECGEVILGAYSSIFAPAMLLQIAAGYIYNPFATQFALYRQTGDRKKYNSLLIKIVLFIFVVASIVMIAAQFWGEFALTIVFGEQILTYVYMMNPILILNFAISYFGFFAMLVIALRRISFLIAAVLTGFVVVIASAVPLIRWLGPNGASYALILALIPSIVILCIGVFLRSKQNEKEVEYDEL